MNGPSEGLVRFMEVAARSLSRREGDAAAPTPFITLSRQAGAGSGRIAQALLDELRTHRSSPLFGGWALFDERLAEKVGEVPALRVSLRGLANEDFLTTLQDMAATWIAGLSPQSEVIQHLFKIVRSLATQGKVIVVGRAGACLTRSIPGGLHLRLVAPLESRVRRLRAQLGLSETEAAAVIIERDRARAALVKIYFQRDIEDPLLYDAVWNTDTVPPEVIASTVVRWLEARWNAPHRLPARRVLKAR